MRHAKGGLTGHLLQRSLVLIAFFQCLLMLQACQSAYYSTMEKFGVEKRDILVDRVDDAREAQSDASEQFESALEAFTALTQYEGGELNEQYQTLKKTFERSQQKAELVTERIDGVERVGEDLFQEWGEEIEQYTNENLKQRSQTQLRQTRDRYTRLLAAMRSAENRIPPVLAAFQDRVLFLKHNLNAQALSDLKNDVVEVQSDVTALVAEMNRAIGQADAFIAQMQ